MKSIWLMPAEEDAAFYQNIIDNLSKRLGTPSFEAHITLTSAKNPTEAQLNKLRKFYNINVPFKVQMKNLGTLHKYYAQFFISGNGGQRLLNLWQKSLEVFEMPAYQYMPHLSLLYGDLDKEIIESLMEEYKDELNRTIVIDHIKIMDTSGEIADWKEI